MKGSQNLAYPPDASNASHGHVSFPAVYSEPASSQPPPGVAGVKPSGLSDIAKILIIVGIIALVVILLFVIVAVVLTNDEKKKDQGCGEC